MNTSSDFNELLPAVDERDQVVGQARRRDIHARGLLHRAVHIMVFDPNGRIYLQKRSANKDTHPLMWTSSASGHVDPGEEYDEAAIRELEEELGLTGEFTPVGKLSPSPELQNEFTWIYRLITKNPPRPNHQEIVEGRYFEWPKALALADDPGRSAPCLKVVMRFVEQAGMN